jgi:hypothetical protein
MTPTKCTATTKKGKPCQARAVRDPSPDGRDPPRCAAHGGGRPAGNQNARTHGFYAEDPAEITIDQAIAGLADKMNRLDQFIADLQGNGEYLIRLFALYTQASGRLARLLRDRRALSGQAADGFAGAIAQALAEMSTELGVDLT